MQENQRKNEETRHKEEIERRRNPKTKKDFEILYNELEVIFLVIGRSGEFQKLKKYEPIKI